MFMYTLIYICIQTQEGPQHHGRTGPAEQRKDFEYCRTGTYREHYDTHVFLKCVGVT